MLEKIQIIILCSNILLLIFVIVFMIIKIGLRDKICRFFLGMLICSLFLCIGDLGTYILFNIYNIITTTFESLALFGISFLPVFLFMFVYVFTQHHANLLKIFILISIIPIISNIICLTNNWHHLYIERFELETHLIIYGKYFFIHELYTYILFLLTITYLITFIVNEKGFFTKQSILLISSIFFPLLLNIPFTFKIIEDEFFTTSITLSLTIIFIGFSIFKFNFLKVLPIALKTVVDRISNAFLVLDKNMNMIDYNKPFIDIFDNFFDLKNNKNFQTLALPDYSQKYQDLIDKILSYSQTLTAFEFEYYFNVEDDHYLNDSYFIVEVTPIISKKKYLGTIVLFKNITEHKKNIQTINSQQEILIEKERLASLGALMGGISHNMRTPLVSISGCTIGLSDLISEYSQSIGNPNVLDNDHREIATEMNKMVSELTNHFNYLSDAITAIKDNTVNPELKASSDFSVRDMIKGIEFLMKYELKQNNCILDLEFNSDKDAYIKGDKGTFVQIINNLISNAIQAYQDVSSTKGDECVQCKIELNINLKDNYIIFSIRDYANGVPVEIHEKLFKDMVTTKGRNGSGIGLYVSYSKVKGLYNGDMWFETEIGNGTVFCVKVPEYLSEQ